MQPGDWRAKVGVDEAIGDSLSLQESTTSREIPTIKILFPHTSERIKLIDECWHKLPLFIHEI
jgi:hypothetical protein